MTDERIRDIFFAGMVILWLLLSGLGKEVL